MKKLLMIVMMMLAPVLSVSAQDGYAGLAVSANQRADWGPGDDTGEGYRIFLGYDLGRFLAVEGGYGSFGTAESDAALHSARGWDAAAVGRLPLGKAAVLGRVGYLRSASTYSDRSGVGRRGDESTSFGVGLEYGRKVRGRVEYTRHALDEGDIDALTLSLVNTFGGDPWQR